MTQKLSSKGIALLKRVEGFEEQAYPDTGGVPTIGYGTTVYPGGRRVRLGDKCTQEQAEGFLAHDVLFAEDAVLRLVKVPLNEETFDALVSFVYNIGTEAFRTSTLLALLNSGNYLGAASQFPRWKFDNGKVIRGLVKRRVYERGLFEEGVAKLELPVEQLDESREEVSEEKRPEFTPTKISYKKKKR
jgi:lysozyme